MHIHGPLYVFIRTIEDLIDMSSQWQTLRLHRQGEPGLRFPCYAETHDTRTDCVHDQGV